MAFKDLLRARTFGWSLLAFVLLVTAMLVPIEWVRSTAGIFGAAQSQKVDAFSPETAHLDQLLERGEPWPAPKRGADAAAQMPSAETMFILVQLRRLTRAGPLPSTDMQRAQKILQEFNPQIAQQTHAGSRNALKTERNRRLVAALPRLNEEKVATELERLDAQRLQPQKP